MVFDARNDDSPKQSKQPFNRIQENNFFPDQSFQQNTLFLQALSAGRIQKPIYEQNLSKLQKHEVTSNFTALPHYSYSLRINVRKS